MNRLAALLADMIVIFAFSLSKLYVFGGFPQGICLLLFTVVPHVEHSCTVLLAGPAEICHWSHDYNLWCKLPLQFTISGVLNLMDGVGSSLQCFTVAFPDILL